MSMFYTARHGAPRTAPPAAKRAGAGVLAATALGLGASTMTATSASANAGPEAPAATESAPASTGGAQSTSNPSEGTDSTESSTSDSSTSTGTQSVSSASTGGSSSGVVDTARGLVGTPYEYGGTTTSGFDCSGFVGYVMDKHGKDVPRTASQQMAAATPVSDPQPGDVVFFGDNAYHNGIYAGDGKIVDAGNESTGVSEREIWTDDVSYGRF